MSKPVVDNYGDKRWYNKYDRLHRLDGPAVEFANGNKYWYANGNLHRLDGPAVEGRYGTKEWYINGEILHGPLDLLKHGANWKDLVEWMTPREIALCRNQL